MKRLLVLFAIMAVGFITLNAQTVVKTDQVVSVSIDTMLVTGNAVNFDYYAKDFLVNNRFQVKADTFTGTGTGDVVVNTIRMGSFDYVNWHNIDTVALSATDTDVDKSDNYAMFYDYVRYNVTVAGTTDSVTVDLTFLFDVNE